MKTTIKGSASLLTAMTAVLMALAICATPVSVKASGGGGGGGGGTTAKVDSIKVTKCFYMPGATGMLVKAASSDVSARLFAYLPDGTYLGELQNGGGSRYGGTVLLAPNYDPGYVVVVSSSGGTTSAPTTPFQI